MDTGDLRKAGKAIFLAIDEAVAKDISEKLLWAADEIDKLRCPHYVCPNCGMYSCICEGYAYGRSGGYKSF